jgi:dTDP-4-dehydrorhamnose reductase
MRWLITGARGQLGTDVQRVLATAGVVASEVRAVGSAELDITDGLAVEDAIAGFRPDVLINAAAYTAVDAAETDVERAYAVNASGPALLAAAAARHDTRMIQVSTDYVFDGQSSWPYQVDDPTGPQSVYGQTKLAGELAVRELAPEHGYIVRTAWVYGATGANFVKTIVKLERSHDTLTVVDDQRGSPTWSKDLAGALLELASSASPAGTYHCTSAGDTTWYHFARAIFAELGADPDRVQPATTDQFPRPAQRPAYSVLSRDSWISAGLHPMRHWRDALVAAFESDGAQLRSASEPNGAAN